MEAKYVYTLVLLYSPEFGRTYSQKDADRAFVFLMTLWPGNRQARY